MADSIREQILDDVVETLAGISAGVTYNTTIKAVKRIKLAGLNIVEFPTIVVIPAEETIAEEPVHRQSCNWKIDLECWIREHGDDDVSNTLNNLLADVIIALLEDHTRGGNAIDTRILSNIPFYSDISKPEAGMIITIEIEYRYVYGDPYTSG